MKTVALLLTCLLLMGCGEKSPSLPQEPPTAQQPESKPTERMRIIKCTDENYQVQRWFDGIGWQAMTGAYSLNEARECKQWWTEFDRGLHDPPDRKTCSGVEVQ